MEDQDPSRRLRILEAALRVFGECGFRGATLKEIARAAGISPGLVYWYFKDKSALFRAAVGLRAEQLLPVLGDADPVAGPPQVVLRDFAVRFLTFFQTSPIPSLALLADVARDGQLGQIMAEVGPGRGVRMLASYLASQQARGVLAPADSGLAAELFLGMLVSQILFDKLVTGVRPPREPSLVAEAVVATFLSGMRGPVAPFVEAAATPNSAFDEAGARGVSR